METNSRLEGISDLSQLHSSDGSDIIYRLFDSMYYGMGIFELCGEKVRALYLNNRYFEIVGYTKEEYRPYLDNITVTMFAEDEKRFLEYAKKNADSEHASGFEVRGYRADGSVGWYSIRTRTVNFIECENPVYIAEVSDCTAAKNTETELRLNTERYRILEEIGATYLFEYDPAADEMVFLPGKNKNEHRFAKYSRQLRQSKSLHRSDAAYFYTVLTNAGRRVCRGSVTVRGSDNKGGWLPCRLTFSSIAGDRDNIIRVLGRVDVPIETDGTDPVIIINGESTVIQKEAAAGISEISAGLSASHGSAVLIMADIDGMTGINEKCGYEEGSSALYAFEKAARELFGDKSVFRYIGDTFLIYIEKMNESEVYYLLDKLRSRVQRLIPEESGLTFSFSAGIAVTGLPERHHRTGERLTADDLILTAAHALYTAKTEGRGSLEAENAEN